MIISRYGITLQQLQLDQIELVRQWRNDPKISRFMFYKGEISPAMQREWFNSIDNNQNFFFIINTNHSPVGLINISSIDWENKTAYTGLFIYDNQFLATDIPVMASLAMLDIFFLIFNIQSVFAKVKGDNKTAHLYNTTLGYNQTKKIEYGLGYEYLLQKEIYLLKTKHLRNAAIRLKGNSTVIQLEPDSNTDSWLQKKLALTKPETLKNLQVEIC